MNAHDVYDDKKEHLNTHLDLLNNDKETPGESQPLQELTNKLMEVNQILTTITGVWARVTIWLEGSKAVSQ